MIKKCLFKSVLFAFVLSGTFFYSARPVLSQEQIHIVEKGDTLWSICEKYYGDSELWPKLWQMNTFVTNPHLLKPGDKITLFEAEPAGHSVYKKTPVSDTGAAEMDKRSKSALDLSSFTNFEYLGFLSSEKPVPVAHVSSSESTLILLAKGDSVTVRVSDEGNCKPGDTLAFYDNSMLLEDPVSGGHLGYVVSILGRLMLKEELDAGFFKAEIAETISPVSVGAPLIRYKSVLPCIYPSPFEKEIKTHIGAFGKMRQIVGKNSVIYLADGKKSGIRRGCLFEILRKWKEVGAPQPNQLQKILGYLIVVDAGNDSSTAVVLSAVEEIPNGSHVRSIDWNNRPELHKIAPCCSLN